jgi:hypothetical protein
VTPDSDPPLPRLPDDPDNLRRLRADALRRLDEEERAAPAPVYGGPSMGGGDSVTRRWTLRRILMILIGAAGAIIALFFVGRRIVAPVYGGPPMPGPDNPPAPVYGGPLPPAPNPAPKPAPSPEFAPKKHPKPRPEQPPQPKPQATVYGGPPPPPPPDQAH